jgi:peroxiredoxin
MTKLIDAFLATQSDKARAKLQMYLDKHMMAICLASDEQKQILKTYGFKV